jgi:anti-sigma B factor antagonist
MSAGSFQLKPGASEDIQIMHLGGTITFSNSTGLQDAVAKATAPRLILDLADVPSLDSMAVGALVRAFVTCNKPGRKLALVGLSHRVRNILQLTGVDPLFEIYATVTEAEQSFR